MRICRILSAVVVILAIPASVMAQNRVTNSTFDTSLASWTALSRVLLNLDETITKE